MEDGKNCGMMFFMVRVDGVESDLNLTTMVESKLERVVLMISLRNLYKDKLAI